MRAFTFRPVSVVILLCICVCAVQSKNVVKHLPGYSGSLPFYLETGYETVDEVNGGELFYYFIESEGNPSKDPLVLWLTGGPGCSVLSGLFLEIGPLQIVKALYNGNIPELEYREYAWTKKASIIFLDSPLGAGFSYSSNPKGYQVNDSISALHIYKFLLKWFVDHPHYLLHPLYVAGDSYAGKIVPIVANFIAEGIDAGQQPLLNFKGYLIGNPVTDETIDKNYRVPFAHGVGIISDQQFKLAQKSCVGEDYSNPNSVLCKEVMNVIEHLIRQVNEGHIHEPKCIQHPPVTKDIIQNRRFLNDYYSIELSTPNPPPFHCRAYSSYLSYFWANSAATQEALGIKKGTVKEWHRCPALPYVKNIRSSVPYHHNVTSRGYRALVYSGDQDISIPFLGTQAWVRSLNFPLVEEWRAWHVNGLAAGFTETYSNNMTFATVANGGHTAPEYRPVECLAMFERWISNQPL